MSQESTDQSPFWALDEVHDLKIALKRGNVSQEELAFLKDIAISQEEPNYSDTDTPAMGTMILGGLTDLRDK